MGLDLTAVNVDYGYKKVWYDARNDEVVTKPTDISDEDFQAKGYYYDDEELETNERYATGSIGYIGFLHFRTDLAEKYGLIDYLSWLETFGTYFYDSKDYGLLLTFDKVSEEDRNHPKFDEYKSKIDQMRDKEYFDLLPILLHPDCDGELPLRDVERIYPKIKEFLKEYIDNQRKRYGYVGRSDEWFGKDFVGILEAVIEHKGKLIFS
jgi:hypothetical protein